MITKTKNYDFCNCGCKCAFATMDKNSPKIAFMSPAIEKICNRDFSVSDAVNILSEARKSPKYDNVEHDAESTMADILFWKSVPYFNSDNGLTDEVNRALAGATIVILARNFYRKNKEFVHSVVEEFDSLQGEKI